MISITTVTKIVREWNATADCLKDTLFPYTLHKQLIDFSLHKPPNFISKASIKPTQGEGRHVNLFKLVNRVLWRMFSG